MQAFMVTVAILAQGTSWAVAVTQAYFTCVGSIFQVPLTEINYLCRTWALELGAVGCNFGHKNLGSHGERLIGDWHELYVRSLPMRAPPHSCKCDGDRTCLWARRAKHVCADVQP